MRGDVRERSSCARAMVGAKLTVEPEQAAEKDPRGVYRLYYDFAEPVARMAPHRTLALNRAEREDVLRVAVDDALRARRAADPSRPIARMRARPSPANCARRSPMATSACSPRRWSARSRAELTRAGRGARHRHLRHEPAQPAAAAAAARRARAGARPGFRTGCKVAMVDENGSADRLRHDLSARAAEASGTRRRRRSRR